MAKKNIKFYYLDLLIIILSLPAFAQEQPLRIDFSGNTEEENQITIGAPGFGTYGMGVITYGAVPTDNAFPGATDGRGAIIVAEPQTGVMVFGPTVPTDRTAIIRCNFRADGPEAQIHVAAIGADENQYTVTSNPANNTVFDNQYRRLAVHFFPPATGFIPLFQVFNTSGDRILTVYIDNFDVYLIDPAKYYSGNFLDNDETDPNPISSDCTGSSTPSQPTPTPIPAFKTPTPTIFAFPTFPIFFTPVPETTPTPTQIPSGAATGLRLVVCKSQAPTDTEYSAGTAITVRVDLVDSLGRIVNPGTEGGDVGREVTVTVSGSAKISNKGQSEVVKISQPQGGSFQVWDSVAELVTVNASAPGLAAAPSASLQFLPAGAISGIIQVWDGEKFVPATQSDVGVDLFLLSSGNETYAYGNFNIGDNGQYTVSGLLPGTYNLRFDPIEPTIIPGIPEEFQPKAVYLNWICTSGINVLANQTTPNINANLGPRTGGAALHGIVTDENGNPLSLASVTLNINLNSTNRCNQKDWSAFTGYDGGGTYSFKMIPAGSYWVQASGYLEGLSTVATSGQGELITLMDGQDMELNLIVKPMSTLSYISPVNYRRVFPPITFQWTPPEDVSITNYSLYVSDRCGNVFWKQENVFGSQVMYSGPPLSNQNLYYWSVMGKTPDGGNYTFSYSMGEGQEPYFLVQ